MLSLTRPQRQALATAAVIGLLVAPTVMIALNALRLRRPEHRQEVASALSDRLGARVTLASVSYPRPGETLLRGVVIRQDDAGGKAGNAPGAGEIARAEVLRLRTEGALLSVEADGLTLRAAGPRQAMAQLGAMLRRAGSGGVATEVALLAPSCHIDPGAGLERFRLRDLAGQVKVGAKGLSLSASLRPDTPGSPRCELTLVHDRRADGLHTTLTVRTADGAALPGGALGPFFVTPSWLGPDARVDGELVLHQANAGDWDARFRGTLHDVDLGTIAGRLAPDQHLRGRGEVTIEEARWADLPGRGPGWTQAAGTITAKTGTIGAGLLGSLRDAVGFRVDARLAAGAESVAFAPLGVRFAIAPTGTVTLAGALGPDQPPGAVALAARGRQPLLSAPEAPARIAGLIRALAPARANAPDEVIPARFEALVIQRYLPAAGVPPAATAPTDDATRAAATSGAALR
jgi:hypothetical protein